ncbi:trithorax group protein osa-like [Hypanus sabinus]|uniref:trithorax group protein osa-like n=1 Tax=Hypanus sabinus TaxID=79690 RepID=UPI0028C48660|nr:trithorax group protein osa-like [Hypanus sabinus]
MVQEQLLPLNHQEGGTGASGPTPPSSGTVITPQPSGRRYRSLRTRTTRFRNSYYPSTIRKEVQEPQDPHHPVQEQLLPLNHQEGGTGASGPTLPRSGTVITPQPSGRRYRSLRTHTTWFRNSYYPSTIRKEVQEPQDPHHPVQEQLLPLTIRKEVQESQDPHHPVQEQLLPLNRQEGGTGASGPPPPGSGTVITPQPSGRRYRSLRTPTTRFRNSYYPSIIRKEVQEPQDPHYHVQEQLLPLSHQEGGTGAAGPTPPGSGTVITPQPSGRRYRSLRTPTTRFRNSYYPSPSGRRYRSLRTHPTRFKNSYYPSTIRKEVQEPQDPHHPVQEQLLPLNRQEGGTGASGPPPPGSGTVITPQPSGRRYRSLRTPTTRFRNSYYPSIIRKEVQEPQDPHYHVQEQLLPLSHQEGGTGAAGPTPPGSGTVITPQPSGS